MSEHLKDFHWKTYLKLNQDLNQNCGEKDATQHYIDYGRFENRRVKIEIPNDFHWQTYLKLNPDLSQNCSEKDAIGHYLNFGFLENRIYQYGLEDLNICSNTICHINHNYGGGIDVYIKNIENIFLNYSHMVINIIDLNHIKINNKLYSFKIINDILNKSQLLFVHNLLYTSNDKMMIHHNVVSILSNNNNIKKILIVHDYFLLFPSTPNPIKSNNLIPSEENISITKDFFQMFQKIYFNSKNCYDNYFKHTNTIENAEILNIVPDTYYYNPRIFPSKKDKYKIGLIGNIGCEHKGRDMAMHVFEMFHKKSYDSYSFVIFGNFGNFGESYSNLTVTGYYENKNIYNLIRDYDIDYFLFLSTFEETYSFTLSIAIHTGLPIIYHNIGCYQERLKEYNNCFPFEENQSIQIIDILNNIEEKYVNENNPKNNMHHEVILYKNMPEWNEYLKIDDSYQFNLENIKNNLKHNAVCFIHICNIDVDGYSYGKDILMDQIRYLKKSGLYNKLDYIFITLLGKHIHIINDYKIKLIYYSTNPNDWEFPHIQRIKYFADNIQQNIKILQIHTKGVFNKPFSHEWRKYLEYFLIEKHELCLSMLDHFYTVGTNLQYYFDNVRKYRNHFSGNFWWSHSNYIKTLSLIEKNEDRFSVEHWLIGNLEKNDYRYFLSLHHTPYDLYQNAIKPEEYNLEIIKNHISNTLTSDNVRTSFIKKRTIYGVYFICCIGSYMNVIQSQINKLIQSGLYENSEQIICFVCQEKKVCTDLLKQYEKMKIVSTRENLYEKMAINNYKHYLPSDKNYDLYYIHSKSVSQFGKCFEDWRNLCDFFTIEKWQLSVKLLEYYDCVGTNLKNFPKKHFSGNFWWSKSEHLQRLRKVNDGYLSTEMYICSYMKTNYVSIYQSYVNHGDTEHSPELYNRLTDEELLGNLCIVPDFNDGDKKCIKYCGEIDDEIEPLILHP